MSPEQMKNYLEKQAEESEKKPKELIGTWKDYLGMASKLGMDVKDPIIYRVRKLEKRHNELVQLMIEKKLDIKAEEITEKFPGIENVCENLRKYRSYFQNFGPAEYQGYSGRRRRTAALHHRKRYLFCAYGKTGVLSFVPEKKECTPKAILYIGSRTRRDGTPETDIF